MWTDVNGNKEKKKITHAEGHVRFQKTEQEVCRQILLLGNEICARTRTLL